MASWFLHLREQDGTATTVTVDPDMLLTTFREEVVWPHLFIPPPYQELLYTNRKVPITGRIRETLSDGAVIHVKALEPRYDPTVGDAYIDFAVKTGDAHLISRTLVRRTAGPDDVARILTQLGHISLEAAGISALLDAWEETTSDSPLMTLDPRLLFSAVQQNDFPLARRLVSMMKFPGPVLGELLSRVGQWNLDTVHQVNPEETVALVEFILENWSSPAAEVSTRRETPTLMQSVEARSKEYYGEISFRVAWLAYRNLTEVRGEGGSTRKQEYLDMWRRIKVLLTAFVLRQPSVGTSVVTAHVYDTHSRLRLRVRFILSNTVGQLKEAIQPWVPFAHLYLALDKDELATQIRESTDINPLNRRRHLIADPDDTYLFATTVPVAPMWDVGSEVFIYASPS